MSAAVAAPAAVPRARALLERVADTHHKATGARMIATAFGFFALAGLAALVLRVQLAAPQQHVLAPESYDQVFTEHGTTMLLLFAVPVMEGFALFIIPSMLGARDVAFPRLAAFGFWLYAFAAAGAWVALAFGEAPNSGWFNYVPLASPRYQPGFHGDIYASTVLLSQIGTTLVALSLVATILTRRARGMSLHTMPLQAWATLAAMLMVLLAMPPLLVDATFLVTDSKFGGKIFTAAAGGEPLLWQHLFWFFGHPLVYLMLLPGLGIVSSVTATFSRRPFVGYPFVVASYLGLAIISFGVWVHHMFATGRAESASDLFSIASFAVAVPSGVHVFAVLATMWHGKVRFEVPLLYVLGFVAVFVMGGITGVMVASMSADWQYTDTYWIVAHFHYVLLGGVLLPALGGAHYWYPKLTGWMPGRRLGIAAFVLIFAGIQLTFFPMHLVGLHGMPRRSWTYPSDAGWGGLNLLETIGAFVLASGLVLYVVNFVASLGRVPAPKDPWGSGTLDAAEKVPERVDSHYPYWEQREEVERGTPLVPPVRPPTLMPLVSAALVAFGVLGTIWEPLLLTAGLLLATVGIVAWLSTPAGDDRAPLEVGVALGMFTLVVATGATASSWWYLAAHNSQWPIPPVEPRSLAFGGVLTVLLGGAAACAVVARRRAGLALPPRAALGGVVACGVAFVVVEVAELLGLDYTQASNANASIEWVVTIAFLMLVLALAIAAAGVALLPRLRPEPVVAFASPVNAIAMLTLTVCAGWGLVGPTLYLGSRLWI